MQPVTAQAARCSVLLRSSAGRLIMSRSWPSAVLQWGHVRASPGFPTWTDRWLVWLLKLWGVLFLTGMLPTLIVKGLMKETQMFLLGLTLQCSVTSVVRIYQKLNQQAGGQMRLIVLRVRSTFSALLVWRLISVTSAVWYYCVFDITECPAPSVVHFTDSVSVWLNPPDQRRFLNDTH